MNILLTGAYPWSEDKIKELESYGFNIIFTEREDSNLEFDKKKIDAVICNWLFVHHEIFDFTNLKYIQLLSAGLDRVPLDYIKEKNIRLFNARGVYSIPIAEFAVSGILQLMKSSFYFYNNKLNVKWEKNRNLLELSGKNILIVGAGSIGNEIAKKLSGFTENIYGVDITTNISSEYIKKIYDFSELNVRLKDADIVILTLPLSDQTRNLFNKEKFDIMKEGSIFVNIARGGLVCENDLIDALNSRLYGAVLDVFEKEPLPVESPLWKLENVILSPHNSFVSTCNNERMWNMIIKNLKQYCNLQ